MIMTINDNEGDLELLFNDGYFRHPLNPKNKEKDKNDK